MIAGSAVALATTVALFSLAAFAQKATAVPTKDDVAKQHMDKVVTCLAPPVIVKGDPNSCIPLSRRMADLHVPGVSIAVIHNGIIEWAQGFGVTTIGGAPVTADTLFQAGSISKPVAALAALRLVQDKKLSLDADVDSELVSWKLPDSAAANGKSVTLRELLTHTAGLTVHGFPGYASGKPVPTLIQVLNGEKPANTAAIRIETEPGTKWNYSGGGYVVMQQILLDSTKKQFPDLMHDTVLAPIGMSHSTYRQPLPSTLQVAAATPYRMDGTPVPGGAHTYPEMTAAGLWTTASDLARYCIEVQRSLDGKANHVLSPDMTREMLTGGKGNWGLGLQIGGSSTDPYFSHGGANEGFQGLFVAYEHHGDGAAVLTKADGGSRLASEIMRSIANEYGWPDMHSTIRSAIELPAESLKQYVGVYQMSPHTYMLITTDGDHLVSQLTGQGPLPLLAEGKDRFFPSAVDAELEFNKDSSDAINKLVLHQNGRDITMSRLNEADAKPIRDQAAATARRIKDQKPAPGGEAAIRENIAGILAEQPKYDRMSPGLAEATRQQLPALKKTFTDLGAIQSVSFKSVGPGGADVYDVKFEHGSTEWRIMMASDGTVDSLGFRPL